MTPQSVSKFLLSEISLEKNAIGDVLGGHEQFDVSTMHAYVDLFTFKEMPFDAAIRHFLSHFRLPGEAAKIDRIMEKFASRYFEENTASGAFADADAAYILGFAVIMLGTDLHSSAITTKITKDQ